MGGLHAGRPALYALVRGVDRQPLVAARPAGDLRPLHLALVLPPRVEPQPPALRTQQELQGHLRVGQCHRLRHGRRLARAHLRLPDVRHPHLVDGEIAARGRLPLREQGDLRPPDAQHAALVPVRAPHDALFGDQKVLLRGREVALPPPEGATADPPQRRGGLQLPGRRHGPARKPGGHLLRRAAQLRGVVRPRRGAPPAQREIYGRQPSGR